MRDELVRLAELIDWSVFDREFGAHILRLILARLRALDCGLIAVLAALTYVTSNGSPRDRFDEPLPA